ncbi:MAG: TIGR04076 family protein, partial [Coriobacteriales bacterium]
TALAGGAIMKSWTNDERIMIACCNDGTRPVIFKIERIDIPESESDRAYLETADFSHDKSDAYTG